MALRPRHILAILLMVSLAAGVDTKKQRPTKILKASDMTAPNLEKVFRYYDEYLERTQPEIIRQYINANNTNYVAPAVAGAGDITAVEASTGLTGGGISGSVAVALDTTLAATRAWVTAQGFGTGAGDITAVGVSTGILGGGLADSVAVALDTTFAATISHVASAVAAKQDVSDTSSTDATRYWVLSQGYGTGAGDIEGVTAGDGLTGGGTTGSVTLAVDTTSLATVYAVGLKQDVSDTNSTDATRFWVQSQGYGLGGGDITEVTASTGITGGGITGAVTIGVDTAKISTQHDLTLERDWSTATFEAKNGYRWHMHYTGIVDAINGGGSAPIPGYVFGLAAQADTVDAAVQADGIFLDSNTEIRLPVDQTLCLNKTSAVAGISLFNLIGKKNITIDGGFYDGLADTSLDYEGDMGVYLRSDTNIVIRNCKISNVGGDNIYIGGSNNVVVENVQIEASYLSGRNGIGITAGNLNADTTRNVKILNCTFTGSAGPGLIDIEPHGTNTVVEDVLIDGCTFRGENGGWVGIEIYGGSGTGVTVKDVIVSNCHFENLYYGVWVENVGDGVLGNIQFNNCTFTSCTVGAALKGGTADVKFNNCKARYCGQGFTSEGVNVNIEYNNCEAGYSTHDGIVITHAYGHPENFPRRVRINSGRYYNNGTDGSGNGIYVHGANDTYISEVNLQYNDDYAVSLDSVYGVIVADCIFENNGTNAIQKSDICNDIVQKGNICGDESNGYQRLVYDQYNYTEGWHRSVVLLDTTACDSVDTAIRIGGIPSYRNSAALNHTTTNNQITFSGFRNVTTNTLGGKFVLQNYATWTGAGRPDYTQEANFLFYLLTDGVLPTTIDNTELKMILTGKGLGLNNNAYITFSSDQSDTAWTTVGEDGYGLRDSSGTVQFKNSGGSWSKIAPVLSDMNFVGVKTGTYAASQGHVWISGDTLFHKYDASNSRFWLIDGTSTKH